MTRVSLIRNVAVTWMSLPKLQCVRGHWLNIKRIQRVSSKDGWFWLNSVSLFGNRRRQEYCQWWCGLFDSMNICWTWIIPVTVALVSVCVREIHQISQCASVTFRESLHTRQEPHRAGLSYSFSSSFWDSKTKGENEGTACLSLQRTSLLPPPLWPFVKHSGSVSQINDCQIDLLFLRWGGAWWEVWR